MPVTTTHPEYDRSIESRSTCRDAIAGQERIKAGTIRYLPASFAEDHPTLYKDFIKRAYWLDVSGRTKAALLGMVFRKPPEQEMGPRLSALIENIDGAGQSLEQVSKDTVGNLLEVGRHGLLVDYPSAAEGMDAETEASLGLRPIISVYPAESIINWRFQSFGAARLLTLVTLREEIEEGLDEYSHDTKYQYRVLRLADGVYTQTLYDDQGQEIREQYAPRMAGGATFNHIPFHIMGAENNLPDVDQPPMLGLVSVNISHYQSTANVEETGWNIGQPMLSLDVGDSDYEEFYALNGGTSDNPPKFKFGSRFSFVSKKGKAEIVQALDSDYNIKLCERKEAQMVMLGARLVQRGVQAETAEASRINASAEASVLDLLTTNASEGIEAALEDMARFLGENPEQVRFKLSNNFWESNLSSQDLMAVIAGVQGTIYDRSTALHMIRTGTITLPDGVTDEEIFDRTADGLLDGIQGV